MFTFKMGNKKMLRPSSMTVRVCHSEQSEESPEELIFNEKL